MRKKETIELLKSFLASELNEQQFFQDKIKDYQESISIQESRKQFEKRKEQYLIQIQGLLLEIQASNRWVTSVIPVVNQNLFLMEGTDHKTVFLNVKNDDLDSNQMIGKQMISKSKQALLEMIHLRNQIFPTTTEVTSISGLFRIKHFMNHSGINYIYDSNERLFEFTSNDLLPYSSMYFYDVCEEEIGNDTLESQERIHDYKQKIMNKIYVRKE